MNLKFVSLLAEPMHSCYRELCRRLTESSLAVEFCEPKDWAEAKQLLEYGEAQVGAVCGLLYTLLRTQGVNIAPIAAPTLQHPRYRQAQYWTDLVVGSNSPVQSLADLRNRTWLFNETQSYSGYRSVLSALQERQLGPDFLGELVETGSHQASFDRLLAGEGDFTALDSTFLDFLPDEQRAQVKVVESLGPAPMPLVVGHPGAAAQFWAACQKLQGLPAPFASLERVKDHDFEPMRAAWNNSLAFKHSLEQWFVTSPVACDGRPFTGPEQLAKDQGVLRDIGRELGTRLTAEATKILPNGPAFHLIKRGELSRHVYLIQPEGLLEGNLTIVGFLSKLKPEGDLAALFEADDRLIEQFHQHEGFLSYSPTEYEPGLWANLAVFRNMKARENWAANSTHLKAIRDLGADSYDNVRLHLGFWPSLQAPQEWLTTRYLNYGDSGDLWRGVRTQAPEPL